MCSGWRKRVAVYLAIFLVLALVLSLERAVIDVLGQMWATMLLNCTAIVCSIMALLGICAKERIVIILYAVWSVLSVGLNIVVILVYNGVGHLAEMETYLGILVGNDNYWKSHGLGCLRAAPDNTSEDGSAQLSSGNDTEGSGQEVLSSESQGCIVSYSIVETIHATFYIFFAMVTFILCLLLVCPRRKRSKWFYYNYDDENTCYATDAQRYDFPDPRGRKRYYGSW